MNDEFWNEGNLMALGAREIVKRHAAEVAELRAEIIQLDIENKNRTWYVTEYARVCQELDTLRAERDAAKLQYSPDDVAFTSRVPALESEIAALRAELSARTAQLLERDAELAAPRQPGVRVPVTWDVTPGDAFMYWATPKPEGEGKTGEQHMGLFMDYLAAHATIAVPPGVPSVEELVDIGFGGFYGGHSALSCANCAQPEQWKRSATAIRDRVVAALAPRPLPSREEVAEVIAVAADFNVSASAYFKEADAVLALFAGCQPGVRPWTDADIEALARVLEDATAEGFEESHSTYLRRIARAAVDFMRAEPPTITLTGKTLTADDFSESDGTIIRRCGCPTRTEAEAKWWDVCDPDDFISGFNELWGWLLPLLPESRTPDIGDPGPLVLVPNEPIATHETLEALAVEGLPSAEWLSDILKTVPALHHQSMLMNLQLAEKLLTALRPWLHTPVGCTLDVTAEEMHRVFCDRVSENQEGWPAVLDFVRSSIRPVYECKECADFTQKVADLNSKTQMLEKRVARVVQAKQHLTAARAALEGE